MKQILLSVFALSLLFLTLFGCSQSQFQFEGNKVIETGPEASEVSYGVISDAHGEVEKARTAAQILKNRGVKGIIIPGDISCNEDLSNRCPKNSSDLIEIEETLSAIAETGLPLFVIPGNHEEIDAYEEALASVISKYPKVIDMTQYRIFDGTGIDFLSLPGYGIKTVPITYEDPLIPGDIITTTLILIPKDGFFITGDEFRRTENLSSTANGPLVLVTHGPGKIEGISTPGMTFDQRDIGDSRVTQLMRKAEIPFAIVGHIHEAGGVATTLNGTIVKPREWTTEMMLNAGTLQNWKYNDGTLRKGMVQIVTFKGNEAKFETININ